MAWTEASARRAEQIRPGDRLVLYVARGAFHNPTRDESQLVGLAEAVGPVRRFPRPVRIAGRSFVCGCDLRLEIVLPERRRVPVRPLVPRLSFVRREEVWGQYFRSGLVRVPPQDLEVLAEAVRGAAAHVPSG
jgi:predicted RNA-binding protein